jgi:mannose-6-phosphate isomerase-like protein (cupin superfamily)
VPIPLCSIRPARLLAPGAWGTRDLVSDAVVVSEDDVEPDTWSDLVRGEVAFRTLFGGSSDTADFTAGVTDLEVGGWLGHHRHQPSEIYYVLNGEGRLSIDGLDHPVRAGTAAFIPGNSEHAIRNTGKDRLRFFYAFAVGSFAEIEYRFTAAQ